jgi:hypothetical protein
MCLPVRKCQVRTLVSVGSGEWADQPGGEARGSSQQQRGGDIHTVQH